MPDAPQRLRPPKTWVRYNGVLLTAIITAVWEGVIRTGWYISPGPVLLLAIVYAAFIGGVGTGVTSAAIASAAMLRWLNSEAAAAHVPIAPRLTMMIVWMVVMGLAALMTGALRRRTWRDARRITEQKHREHALRAVQERFELAGRATRDALRDHDLRRGRVWLGAGFRETFGYDTAEVEQNFDWWAERVHPEDSARIVGWVRSPIERGTDRMEVEYRFRRADGSYTLVLDRLLVVRDAHGEPARLVGAITDLTARRAADDALRESNALLAAFFDSGDVMRGIVELTDDDVLLVRVNAATARSLGVAPEQTAGRTATELGIPRENVEEGRRRYLEARSTGRAVRFDYTRRIRDEDRQLSAMVVSLGDGPSGRPRFAYAVEDVTERIQLEEEVRHAQKMDAIGRLAGGIAHDFGNLLTAVVASAGTARRSLTPGHPAEVALRRVDEAARRAVGISRSLLTLGRDGTTEKKPVPLSRVTAEVAAILGSSLPARINLDHAPSATDDPWVIGDEIQLQQVVINLAINARDAMPDGGTLRIVVETRPPGPEDPGPMAAVVVRDDGCGMTPEVRDRIFEPFFTTKPPDQGTGLGLPIALGIVRAHGGRIEVQSEPGRGTVFTILLPAAPAPLDPETPGPQPGAELGGIVVVRDPARREEHA